MVSDGSIEDESNGGDGMFVAAAVVDVRVLLSAARRWGLGGMCRAPIGTYRGKLCPLA